MEKDNNFIPSDFDDLELESIDSINLDDGIDTTGLVGEVEFAEEEAYTSNSSSTLERIVEGMSTNDGLPEDIILDLIRETDIEHRKEGIDSSYAGRMRSENKINELLQDVDVPIEIKTETITHENVLNISNYSDFLLLQSRLTGVPFNTLVNGLKIFEEGITEEQITANETGDFEFADDTLVDSYMQEEVEDDEDEDLYTLDEIEEEFDLDEEEEEEISDEVDLVEDEDLDIVISDNVPSADIDLEEDSSDYTDLIEEDNEELTIEDDMMEEFVEDEPSDEILHVASPTDVMFNASLKNKVNSSRTYALHYINAGGNYDV